MRGEQRNEDIIFRLWDGAAGDMLTASLLQLFSEPVKQVKKLNDLKNPRGKISVGGVYKIVESEDIRYACL